MTTDIKHQVLFAVYAEYQKDIPNMDMIIYKELGIDSQAFVVALLKLQNEGYIQGVVWNPADTMVVQKIKAVKWDNLFMTRHGVEYVENQTDIEESMQALDKIKKIGEQAGLFGLDMLKTFILSKIS